MRETLNEALKSAMRGGDRRRVETIRLVNAAIKDRDIEARGRGATIEDADILALLQKMTKSRQESLDIYTKAGRDDLAQVEAEEIDIIAGFLPKPMAQEEIETAVASAIAETGASSIKDMGKVVGLLKSRHSGRMDFGKASSIVKAKLVG